MRLAVLQPWRHFLRIALFFPTAYSLADDTRIRLNLSLRIHTFLGDPVSTLDALPMPQRQAHMFARSFLPAGSFDGLHMWVREKISLTLQIQLDAARLRPARFGYHL